MRWPWSKKPKVETRQGQGFTAEIISARAQFFSGSRGAAEATAVAEARISLWKKAFMVADLPERWQSIVTPRRLGLLGHTRAIRGADR